MENIKKIAIDEILNEWFEEECFWNGTDLKFSVKIKNDYLKQQSETLYNKQSIRASQAQFNAHYLIHCYLSIDKFTATDAEWQAMAEMTDTSRLVELSKYVYATVPFKINEETSENIRIRVDGDKRAPVYFNTVSLDQVLQNETGEVSLIDLLDSDSNLFSHSANDTYFKSHFSNWFEENKQEILTDSQLYFLEALNKVDYLDATTSEIEKTTGVDNKNMSDTLNRIANRILKAYNKKNIWQVNERHKQYSVTAKLLEGLRVLTSREEDCKEMNQNIWSYIVNNINELQSLLIDKLDLGEHQQINTNNYNTKLLYKVVDLLMQEYDRIAVVLNDVSIADKQTEIAKKPKIKIELIELPKDTKKAIIVGKDGFLEIEKEDEYDMPDASEMRIYNLA